MNAADLARLELARRAYQAAQPNENEIQTGVRRARLALGRRQPRRTWFSKGLVFVVLAVGGLAYAKPHALGELVENAWPHANAGAATPSVGAAAPSRTDVAATTQNGATPESANAPSADSANAPSADRKSALSQSLPATPAPSRTVANAATASNHAKPSLRSAAAAAAVPAERGTQDAALSDWGRVGQALARGDESQALAALAKLSESDDQHTRDKADMGRAHLLMAHGDRDQACALARGLTNRRAGSGIERQAQALLKSCTR